MLSMRYLHAQTAAPCHPPPPPDQCGYACLLCLNSGSVAPLVGLSIMMLRIISCSVKGYTSLSLVVFVPNITTCMSLCACVGVTIFILQFWPSNMQHIPPVPWRPALYEYWSGSACCLYLPGLKPIQDVAARETVKLSRCRRASQSVSLCLCICLHSNVSFEIFLK